MFTSLKRIVYVVDDLDRAKQWYSDVLQITPLFDSRFVAIFPIGACSLSLAKKTAPRVEPENQMAVYWEVDDLDAAYKRLLDAGATSHAPIKEVLNIRTAQVIDPFGNLVGLTGPLPDVQSRTVEQRPSETATSAAFCRALAAKDDRREIRGPDTLAELFMKQEGKKLLIDAASRTWAIQRLVSPPLYGFMLARTAFIDALFTNALAEGTPQIVLLGAGFDTRAYRFRNDLKATRIFELDIASTQNRKLEVIREANIAIPPQVTFVAINFKMERIEDVLAGAGFNETQKTLFIWEGVTYYLTQEAIRSTMSFVRTHSAPGSILCFDYLTEKLESVNPAEPFLSWIDARTVPAFLREEGFALLEHLDSKEMQKRYLTLADGNVAEPVLPQFRFVSATVAG
jgi:methyltransferase (TIGR00027 family)